MSQAPIPGPLKYIPEGGGGGGEPTGPTPTDKSFDYETEAYGLNDLTPEEKGITEEEQASLDSINNAKMSKTDMAKAAAQFAFMGHFAGIFSAYRSNKKAKEDAIAAAKAAQQQREFEAAKAKQSTSNPGGRLGGPDGKSGENYAGGTG